MELAMATKMMIGLCLFCAAFTPLVSASAEPARYVIDSEHTHIVWRVDRFGFTDTIGTFTEIAGILLLDEDNPASSSVEATIQLSGLRSDLLQREDIVRGPHWLDAAAFPAIEFQSHEVVLDKSDDCQRQCAFVTGTMTLKGVSAPLSMYVILNKIGVDPVTKKPAAGFSAKGQFTRSEFGVGTAVGPVGDVVSFEIEALAIASE